MPQENPRPVRIGDPVTVVIPAYNLDRYLEAAVESVLKQDYAHLQSCPGPLTVIILDDGSQDRTLEIAQQLATNDPRISVYTQENQGRVRTRNRLLHLAPTELVAWLDGDDLAHPAWIREQLAHMAAHPTCAAVGGHGYAMTARGRAIGPIQHPLDGGEIEARHLAGQPNAFFQSCVLTRKSLLIRAGGYRERYPAGEDYDLWLRLAEIAELANVDRFHLLYRVHDRSANWTIHDDQRNQGREIVREARERRGLAPLEETGEPLPPPKRDDWNRRVYWINIALRSGNPRSALEMLWPAIAAHPASLLLWLFALVALGDAILFAGNRTRDFRAGEAPEFRQLPRLSCYRLGRALIRQRRKWRG